MHQNLIRSHVAALVIFAVGACGSPQAVDGLSAPPRSDGDADRAGDDLGDSPSGDTDGAGRIEIYIVGDMSDVTQVDGLTGQTPREYEIAINRYEVMAAANDPDPIVCFDHDTPRIASMAGETLVGTCGTDRFPTGDFTYGRTTVAWARYTVDGTLHTGFEVIDGAYTFFRAYSDTTYDGVDYLAGQGLVTFDDGVTSTEIPWVFLDLPSGGGVELATRSGQTTMTFPFTQPLHIEHGLGGVHWTRFHWQVFESFRWQEVAYVGYADGRWDTSTVAAYSEVVWVPGVLGYFVTSSED